MAKRADVQCNDCGISIPRGTGSHCPRYCPDCSVKRFVRSIVQLRRRSGPAYEAYVKNKGAYYASKDRRRRDLEKGY